MVRRSNISCQFYGLPNPCSYHHRNREVLQENTRAIRTFKTGVSIAYAKVNERYLHESYLRITFHGKRTIQQADDHGIATAIATPVNE